MSLRLHTGVRHFPTPHPEADGTLEWEATTAVTVLAESGSHTGTGWTYSDPAAAAVVDGVLKSALAGADPHDPPLCWQRMVRACRNIGATGLVMQAISAVDIALWDLHARSVGVDLPRLWGAMRPSVRIYGSGGFVNEDESVLVDDIAEWTRMGATAMKIKIGQDRGGAVDRDLHRVRTLVDTAPAGTECMVDANGAYTPGQALRVGRQLDDLGVVWFEEPVTSDDPHTLGELADALDCDVTAGEYAWTVTDAQRLVPQVDCLQLDVTRCGGYTGWFSAAAVAAGSHREVSAHCAPALHTPVAAATANLRHLEYFIDHARLEPQLADGVPTPSGGVLTPSSAPGHGLTLRDA